MTARRSILQAVDAAIRPLALATGIGADALRAAPSTARRDGEAAARATSSVRIPGLDGLRAISIAAVVLNHLSGTRGFPLATGRELGMHLNLGILGVRVFFVISGLLITGLLMAEHRRTGRIEMPRFFFRRTLRIFPAYWAYVAVVLLLAAAGIVSLKTSDVVHAVTYTMNYAAHPSWTVGHLWSLAVEEQFYLLWPLTIAAAGLARSTRVAVLVVLLVPLIRVVELALMPERRWLVGTTFETSADALAMGCVLALTRDRLITLAWYRRVIESRWIIPTIALVGFVLLQRYRVAMLLGHSVLNLAIALGVDRCVRRPEGVLGRILNLRALAWIGTMSYSLYLWQQLFIDATSASWWHAFPVNIILAAAAAVASYHLVERPCLSLRVRLERRLFKEAPGAH